jgi:hypothetical protein
MRRCFCELVLFLLSLSAVLGVSPAANANVARPWGGGQIVGEPAGVSAALISHEDLVIDLRGLEHVGGLVDVTASYDLENRGAAEHLDLVFASGASDLKKLRVTFDGGVIATRVDRTVTIPLTWQAPARTPRPDGMGTLLYELDPSESAAPVLFSIDLPPGRHRLSVSYSADAMVHRIGEPTVVRQFAYVLAPARTWNAFGGLDVTVHVPPGWGAAASPTLTRDGDTLHAMFGDLPADAITMAVQAPPTRHRVVRLATLALLVVVAIGGARLVRLQAKRRAELIKRPGVWAAFGWGAAWSFAFFTVGVLAVIAPSLALPFHLADTSGYGHILALLLVVAGSGLVLIAGAVLFLKGSKSSRA